MIVFDLECQTLGHRFEGWFASSDDFASQQTRGLLTCPNCGSGNVVKAVMAPSVGRKGNQVPALQTARKPVAGGALPAQAQELMAKLALMQAEALKQSTWVGEGFADASRAMHYGERETETIHGQATASEAKDLLDEGIAVMPLLIPVTPPEELN
jgi:hypothetical protein